MARTVLPIAGAIVGAYFGGAAGAQWGYAAGSLIAGAIPQQAQGPRIGETGAQTSAEGVARAIVYGTCQVTGNVIASGPLIKRDVEENQGGKGGTDVSNEHAYRTFAVRICEGPIVGILRVWEDDKLVYDVRPTSTMQAESVKWASNKVFYLGTESQLPDPSLQMIFGTDETPAHRGTVYMVAIEDDLTDRRGSIPQYRFEASAGGEIIELDVVPTSTADGLTGSGDFSNGTSTSVYIDALAMGPGEVWLVTIDLSPNPLAGPTTVGCYVKIGGAQVWSSSIAVHTTPVVGKVQINHISDHTQVEYGFTGVYSGFFRLRISRLSPGDVYTAYADVSTPPVVYADEHEFFGVLVDEDGGLHSADEVIADDLIIAWGPATFDQAQGQPTSLSLIVSDIHARCNFPAGQFDVSELTDMVSGLVLAGEYTGADAINTLRSLYLFDAADQDKMIVYPKRGKTVVATITEDDIVEAEESSRREQAIEYPKKLHLSYQNAVGGYAVAKATSARSSPDVRVVGEVSTSVPVVLSPDQAAQTAAIMHKIAWAEAEGETKLSVPLSWIKYIASDCFGVALRGRVTRERLDELNTADGVIEYTLRRDRQSAYTSQVTGIPIAEPTPPPSTIVGETVLAVLDISPRSDSEDDLNLLYAVSGGLPAWNGATVQRSLDAGANFSSVANINRGPVLGALVRDLADASEFYTDTTNVLRVQLYRDTQTIESITDVQLLSEGGAFAVQRPDGSWEVMQYRDSDEVSPGVFDLSYMHRGQLNSGTSAHLAGALFVMLADAVHVPAQSAWIGTELTHRAVSYGESPETADEQTQTYLGRSQTEWPVAYLQLSRDVSNNVTGTWTPRHRFGTEDSPVASVNFRGYRVTLSDGVLPAVTFDTTAQTFTYAAGALGTPLTVSVAALNRITGQGPSTSGAI